MKNRILIKTKDIKQFDRAQACAQVLGYSWDNKFSQFELKRFLPSLPVLKLSIINNEKIMSRIPDILNSNISETEYMTVEKLQIMAAKHISNVPYLDIPGPAPEILQGRAR